MAVQVPKCEIPRIWLGLSHFEKDGIGDESVET